MFKSRKKIKSSEARLNVKNKIKKLESKIAKRKAVTINELLDVIKTLV